MQEGRLKPYYLSYNLQLFAKEGQDGEKTEEPTAKKLEDEMLWEARKEVVIINAEGKKLETELLYWDMKKEWIYSDRYVKLSADGQNIEGNNGFHSDQNLNHPVFENISGSIEVEKQQRKQ